VGQALAPREEAVALASAPGARAARRAGGVAPDYDPGRSSACSAASAFPTSNSG
jgi:hypothetical protein